MSHFNLGNTPMTTESSAKNAYKGVEINGPPKDTSEVRDRMQKGYFVLGNDKNRKMPSETTYTTGISADKGKSDPKADKDDRMHLKGSINFGNHPQDFVSEAKEKYFSFLTI